MNVSGIHHDVGKATTPDEFHRIALTVAFALSNPCKFHHYFTYMWFILQSDQTDWDVERLADRVENTLLKRMMQMHLWKIKDLPNTSKIRSLENLTSQPL